MVSRVGKRRDMVRRVVTESDVVRRIRKKCG